jgi:FkbM family methyltransferase
MASDPVAAGMRAAFHAVREGRQPAGLMGPVPCKAKVFWGAVMEIVLPELVSVELAAHGYIEPSLTSVVLQNVRAGMVAFDIGAHFGYFSLLMSELTGPCGMVHAFEPSTETHQILRRNVVNATNVRTVHAAVHSRSGRLTFRDLGVRHAAFNSFYEPRLPEAEGAPAESTYEVDTISIDDYVRSTGVRPDFVKIDAESSEYQIVAGMEETLRSARPVFTLEVGDFDTPSVATSRELVDFACGFDYEPFCCQAGVLMGHRKLERYEYDNLLFIPREQANSMKHGRLAVIR